MARGQEGLRQKALRVVVASKSTPGQDAGLWSQVIEMPVAGLGAMHVAVQAGRQAAFGTADISVVAAWKSDGAQSANRGFAEGAKPQHDDIRSALGRGNGVKRPA